MIVPGVPTVVLLSRASFNLETADLAMRAGDMDKAREAVKAATDLIDQARKQIR